MSDSISTTATLDNLLQTYYVRKALPRLIPKAVLYYYGDKQPLPKGNGKTVRFNQWVNLAKVSCELTEGEGNSLAATSSKKIEATVKQYGRGVYDSDFVIDTASLDVVQGTIDNLTDCAALSVDAVVQLGIFKNNLVQNDGTHILSAWQSAVVSAYHPGTNTTNSNKAWGFPVIYAGQGSVTKLSSIGDTTSARMCLHAIRKAVKALREKNALEFADGRFKGVMNSDAASDLGTDPQFKQWYQYTTPAPMEMGVAPSNSGSEGAMGSPRSYFQAEGVTFYVSNNLPSYRSTTSANLSFIWGQGAYGCVNINNPSDKGFEIIIKRPNIYATNDPFNVKTTLAFKFAMVGVAKNVSSGRILISRT